MRTLQQLAKEATDVQNTSNPLGVSKGYATSLQELRDRLQEDGLSYDTDAISTHPINQLWASKLHDLARMGLSDMERYGVAYEACKSLAAAK